MNVTTAARQQITVRVTARSPLAFAERKPGAQFRDSQPYVPGAAIFGALGRYLAEEGRFDEAFLRRLRCHNAYPAREGDQWVRPVPLTALQPKGKPDAQVIDALVERVCWEQQQPAALIYLPTDDDGRPYEMPGWRFYALDGGAPVERRVSQRVLTRVAINRQRGTAEDQRLYSPLVLTESTYNRKADKIEQSRFLGSITVNPVDAATLTKLLPQLRYLGGRQSTGLGAVTVEPVHVPGAEPSLVERIEQLTTRFQQQAALYQRLGGKPWNTAIAPRSIFTVNLLSDTILLEQGWLPTQVLSEAMLKELTGIEASLLRSFTRTLTVGGWATLWQQPKATNLAVGMGSLYVFQTTEALTEAQCLRLEQVELDGIGERQQEGFGQVRICDAFHLIEQPGSTKEGHQ